MTQQEGAISDREIISMIRHSNPDGWKYLYDKYALMMYVATLWIMEDDKLAEGVLALLFVQLRTNKSLLESQEPLCVNLLHHTRVSSLNFLRNNEVTVEINDTDQQRFPNFNCWVYKPYPSTQTERVPSMIKQSNANTF